MVFISIGTGILYLMVLVWSEGARGVMVIVVGIEHDDTSSNPGPG